MNTLISTLTAPRRFPAGVLLGACLAGLLVTGCGGKKDQVPEYKMAKIGNPLEIPPDLSRVPPDVSTAIPPGSAAGRLDRGSTDRDFADFERFKKWSDFEEYQDWKTEGGVGDTEYQAFLASMAPGYVMRETGKKGQAQLRVRDDVKNVWIKVRDAIPGLNLKSHVTNPSKRLIVATANWEEPPTGKGSFWRGKFRTAYDIEVDEDSGDAVVTVKPRKKASPETADTILNELLGALRVAAKFPEQTRVAP